jgi:ParB/RepB/Spo0J family partition protein
VTWVPAELIDAGPNDRKTFDRVKLEGLAETIRADGLLTPPLVRPMGGRFELVAGERRKRAICDVLGCAEVPVIVANLSDDCASATMLFENGARDGLDPMAEAHAWAKRRDEQGWSVALIASRAGVTPATVRDRMRLLELSPEIAHWVERGDLPLNYALAMVGLDSNRQHLALEAFAGDPRPGIDVFRRVCGKLADDQGADAMFDPDAFMAAETVVLEEIEAEAETVATSVREKVLGLTEIAEACHVARDTPHVWRNRGILPAPDLTIGGTHAWWATTIRDWCWGTGRKFDMIPWMDVRQDVSLG